MAGFDVKAVREALVALRIKAAHGSGAGKYVSCETFETLAYVADKLLNAIEIEQAESARLRQGLGDAIRLAERSIFTRGGRDR